MTFPRLEAMQRYWREYPPPHITILGIAQALGYKSEPKEVEEIASPESSEPSQDQVSEFLTNCKSLGFTVEK